MKIIKNIVPILVQHYYMFGGSKCCPNNETIAKEKQTEIVNEEYKKKEENKKIEEEDIKNKFNENLRKINEVKNKEKTDEQINNLAKNTINNNFEQPKGDKTCDDIISKFQNEEKEENDIPTTENNTYKHIKDEFTEDPKIGLENIGATCYMNATLQCFSHISKFVEYFKYRNNPKFDDKNSLSYSFKLLIDNLWSKDSTRKYYSPYDFKQKISDMNPLFQGVAANDSKDLVNFIIMTLHEELNNPISYDVPNSIFLDQRDWSLMFNAFINQFTNQNRSKISDLFYGVNCSITQCCNCRTQLYNYQTYFFLVFPLEEVRKYNISMYNNLNPYYNNQYYNYYYNQQMLNNINNNTVTIYDCFNYDRKINTMSDSNQMYCNYCKNTCPANMMTTLTTGPEILILLLNRGKGIEFPVKVLFNEILDLTNYIQYNNLGAKYKLIGVITHLGGNGMDGHFIAYCKDPITGKWNKFNDGIVSEVTDFQGEVINLGMPYLLFYEKIK